MKKKKATRSTQEVKPRLSTKKPLQAREVDTQDEDNRFDLGGIPERDLKKNLGCG